MNTPQRQPAHPAPCVRTVALPEIKTLRELRHIFARGGARTPDCRTPEDWARLASFEVVSGLVSMLEAYRRRVERGERCRLITQKHERPPTRFTVEIVIEEQP